jgi:hypothetical protein
MPIPWPLVIEIALTAFGITSDFIMTDQLHSDATQLEYLLSHFKRGMTFEEFVANCWIYVMVGLGWIWFLLAVAFPKRGPRGARGRWAR